MATLRERPAELLVVGGARSHPKSKAWANPQAFDYFGPVGRPGSPIQIRPNRDEPSSSLEVDSVQTQHGAQLP